MELVEKTVIENGIILNNSFKNNRGDNILVCDSLQSRDRLKQLISETDEEIQVKTPSEKKATISIVGLSRNYEKEEVVEQIRKQNQGFDDIENHIKVFSIKPLKKNPNEFQALANVSVDLRKSFKSRNDKIMVGIRSCKIYDQYFIKRCNNCQCFGHYYQECPLAHDQHVCARCASDHSTSSCESQEKKCANCIKDGLTDEATKHYASDSNCPSLKKRQEVMKSRLGNSLKA